MSLVLTGLDGSNPLGFLAALGVVNVLADRRLDVRLSWGNDGVWRPTISGAELEFEALVRLLDEDRESCEREPAFEIEYDGKRDLRPPPLVYRARLQEVAQAAVPNDRRSADWLAAFATDVAVDNNGNTKPTALHFTAGQQQFLKMAAELQAGVNVDDLSEALRGPWQYSRSLPVLGWDATAAREYALRAGDPAGEKKLGTPGADWLALRGLPFVGVVPRGDRVLTTGCTGEWKTGRFRWPLWDVPLSRPMISSVMRLPLERMSPIEKRARGIGAVFQCGIRRSDQGGYGNFTPPSPA